MIALILFLQASLGVARVIDLQASPACLSAISTCARTRPIDCSIVCDEDAPSDAPPLPLSNALDIALHQTPLQVARSNISDNGPLFSAPARRLQVAQFLGFGGAAPSPASPEHPPNYRGFNASLGAVGNGSTASETRTRPGRGSVAHVAHGDQHFATGSRTIAYPGSVVQNYQSAASAVSGFTSTGAIASTGPAGAWNVSNSHFSLNVVPGSMPAHGMGLMVPMHAESPVSRAIDGTNLSGYAPAGAQASVSTDPLEVALHDVGEAMVDGRTELINLERLATVAGPSKMTEVVYGVLHDGQTVADASDRTEMKQDALIGQCKRVCVDDRVQSCVLSRVCHEPMTITESWNVTYYCISNAGYLGGWAFRVPLSVALQPQHIQSLSLETELFPATVPEHMIQSNTVNLTLGITEDAALRAEDSTIRHCTIDTIRGIPVTANLTSTGKSDGSKFLALTVKNPAFPADADVVIKGDTLLISMTAPTQTLANGGPLPPPFDQAKFTMTHVMSF